MRIQKSLRNFVEWKSEKRAGTCCPADKNYQQVIKVLYDPEVGNTADQSKTLSLLGYLKK